MKKTAAIVAMAAPNIGVVHAQDKKELTPRLSLMASCDQQGMDKNGDERKKSVSECVNK